MSLQGSVSRLLEGLKAGADPAARALWERYCERLARLARGQLLQKYRRVADEDDIALSAFKSLCLGARNGRFPSVTDRNSLWGLLVFLTAQKTADWIAHQKRLKRGGGKVRGHSALAGKDAPFSEASFDRLFSQSPSPAALSMWAEEYERRLDRLGDETLRKVAELSVQGYKIDEIAENLGLARRTINRKLNLIRKMWLADRPS
jgi:DNA-directed RNA polymerase specialized sigma24 family protein